MGAQLSRINEDKTNRWMQHGVSVFVIVLNTIWCVHLTRFGLERFAADLPAQDWSWLLNWQTTCNCEHYSLYKTAWPHTGAPWYNDTTQRLDHKKSSDKDSASPNPHTHCPPWPPDSLPPLTGGKESWSLQIWENGIPQHFKHNNFISNVKIHVTQNVGKGPVQ